MKSLLKSILVAILGNQVRRLRARRNPKIVGVVGSIGKTSTKLAIAKVLSSHYRVRYQEGNYNDIVSVPLVFFGHPMPKLWNIFGWLKIFFLNEFQILFQYPFDFVVVELGTDAPGQIALFRKYLNLDVAVITAVTPEHMEFFDTLEKVAEEEWSVSFFSKQVFANRDLVEIVPDQVDHQKIVFYGKNPGSYYKIDNLQKRADNFEFNLFAQGKEILNLSLATVSEVAVYSAAIAAILALQFKIAPEKIKKSVGELQPFAGRMQKLLGKKGSIIIDDTYNASPESMKIALTTLYAQEATERIAILGMMNELGTISKREHEKVGALCDPKLLDLVVTIGRDANEYLAKAAEARGCQVYRALNSKDAGEFVKEKIKNGAVILAKGSQNGVFAEEAVKVLLKDRADIRRLVRQDRDWLSKKSIDF